ncbi:MAG: hypothetical protein GY841_19820 [FCB group bacterium]|nr:hypothetical protein [FCB group bacterium]
MKSRNYLIIALLSVTLIALELTWTRIFSAEYFYTFAFLTLSLAIMGLGLGALALRLFRFLDRPGILGISLSLTGLMALIGPTLVFKLSLRFSQLFSDWSMIGKFALTVVILSSAFFFGGIALARLFRDNHKEMPRLYMADLVGAGAGVLVAVWWMNQFGTPWAAFLIVLPVLLAALIASPRMLKIIPIALMIALFLMGGSAVDLISANRPERMPVIYSHWDAMAKVKLYDYGGGEARGINIDNVANSPVYAFDGNWDKPDSMRYEFGIAVDYLIKQFDSCTFLSLGAGGGVDVLQALQEGATEVHAVEINPHINYMMSHGDSSGYLDKVIPAAPRPGQDTTAIDSTVEDTAINIVTLAEFSGYIYDDPRVIVATEDARAYVRRFENKFDVIYSLSSNTWAALASGSFALAENYLFTTEAFMDYWTSLSDSGFLMMEHQFYMPRLVSEVKDALTELGVEDINSHFAVYDLPQMRRNLLLLSKRPLDDSLRYHAIFDLTPEVYDYIHLLYPAPDSLEDNLINQIVQRGWKEMADSVEIDISPCTDNRPFIAQMGKWENFTAENREKILPYEFFGFPLSKVIIVIILIVVVVMILPLNLLPYLGKGEKLRLVPWMYFFVIGMAFMIIEVILMQKYALFVGPSAYSIAIILFTLLITSGIGSRFSKKFGDSVPFTGIIIWLILDIFLLGHITSALAGMTMALRILITAILIAPLGFFMGMPFPKAALRVGTLIDWGFAVNGAASVLGATSVILVAVSYGYTAALILGGVLYLLAMLLLAGKRAW